MDLSMPEPSSFSAATPPSYPRRLPLEPQGLCSTRLDDGNALNRESEGELISEIARMLQDHHSEIVRNFGTLREQLHTALCRQPLSDSPFSGPALSRRTPSKDHKVTLTGPLAHQERRTSTVSGSSNSGSKDTRGHMDMQNHSDTSREALTDISEGCKHPMSEKSGLVESSYSSTNKYAQHVGEAINGAVSQLRLGKTSEKHFVPNKCKERRPSLMSNRPQDLEQVDQEKRAQAKRRTSLSETDGDVFDPEQVKGCRGLILQFEKSFFFEIVMAVLIVANSITIGLEVDSGASSTDIGQMPAEAPLGYQIANYVFTISFLLELLLRLYSHRWGFFTSDTRAWNYLDLFIVSSSLVEVGVDVAASLGSASGGGTGNVSNIRIIRMVRITRLIRVLRVARVVRFIRALRTLLSSIMFTLRSLVWAMLLLLMIIYIFGIAFTQAVGSLDCDALPSSACTSIELDRYWGSLPSSMHTLFKSFTSGLSWEEAVTPLEAASLPLVFLFLMFICFTHFAVLNVVTGVFVQAAIDNAARDQDNAVHNSMTQKRVYVDKVTTLFHHLNGGISEGLTYDVFEKHMEDEEMVACFAFMELDVDDAWVIFKLLDVDGGCTLDAEEFINGCLRLKGPAKSIQVAQMICDQRALSQQLANFMKYSERQFVALEDHLMFSKLLHT